MKLLTTFFLALIWIPGLVKGSGIAVSPAKLELTVEAQTKFPEALAVTNPTADVLLFEVYPDEFNDLIKLDPATFIIEAGGKQYIAITFDPDQLPDRSSSLLTTNISVVSKPLLDSRFQANTGVKIPITLSYPYQKPRSLEAWLIFSISLAILLTLKLYCHYHKRQRPKPSPD